MAPSSRLLAGTARGSTSTTSGATIKGSTVIGCASSSGWHRLASKKRRAAEHCRGLEANNLSQAAIQTTIVQIYEALRDVTPGELKKMLADDPRSYARIVNSLSRLSKESLNLQKHRDAAAKAVAAELKRLDPKREFTDREDELITQRMDDFFLKPRRRRTAEEAVQSPKSDVQSSEAAKSNGGEQSK